jgi:hypothetical protein
MNRPPSVPRNFEEHLSGLIGRIRTEGWDKKHSLDTKTLETDLKAQREDRQRDQELEQSYKQHHRQFLGDQAERYQRYMKSLQVLRAVYRDEPAVLRSLDLFKRTSGPRGPRTRRPQ